MPPVWEPSVSGVGCTGWRKKIGRSNLDMHPRRKGQWSVGAGGAWIKEDRPRGVLICNFQGGKPATRTDAIDDVVTFFMIWSSEHNILGDSRRGAEWPGSRGDGFRGGAITDAGGVFPRSAILQSFRSTTDEMNCLPLE